MSFNRFVLFIVAGTFLLFSTGALARQGDEESAKKAPVKKAEKKTKKKVADKDARQVSEDASEEDAFADDDAFAEKEAEEAAERDAQIAVAVEAAKVEALKTCPTCEGPGEGLQLSQWTIALGGTITASFDWDIPKDQSPSYDEDTPNEQDKSSMTGGNLTIWPEAGLFVYHQLEIFLGIGFSVMLGEIRDHDLSKYQLDYWNSFGFDLGMKYFFATGTIISPYMGARFGVDIKFAPEPPEAVEQWEDLKYFVIGVPIGILIGLSKHVALDVGLQFQIDVSLNSEDDLTMPHARIGHRVHLPFGYLGIQAFIPTK